MKAGVKPGDRRRPQVAGVISDLNLLPAQMVKLESEKSGDGCHCQYWGVEAIDPLVCVTVSQEKLMALRLEDKKAFVKEVNAVAGDSLSAVAAEYRGLSVAEMTELRKEARDAGVYMRVVKNTLARRAVEGTEFECMKDTLKGPILLAFAKEDPGAAARVIKDFAKEHEALKAVSLSAGGQLMPASDLAKLADLPTLDQARAMLLGVMIAPMSKLVRTLAEPPAMLARTLSARGSQEAA
jgi:large subunit ribosomal protein L10